MEIVTAHKVTAISSNCKSGSLKNNNIMQLSISETKIIKPSLNDKGNSDNNLRSTCLTQLCDENITENG